MTDASRGAGPFAARRHADGPAPAAAGDDIPYVRELEPAYGEAVQVSPGIRRVTARNPGPMTYLGTGTYIVGRGEVAVIDPGPDLPEHLEALKTALAGERIAAIVVTHSHSDHSPLAAPLAAAFGGPPIYGRADPALAEAGAGGGEAADARFRPDVEVAEGQAVRGPGWTLVAMGTPGHVSNHVAYAFPEENALFVGDHVMGWSTTVIIPPHGEMDAYLDSLDKVRDGGFETLWPTHGPPIREPDRFLRAYKGHRLARERAVLAVLERGPATIPALVRELYAKVDPRLHPAAERSVWAHLIRLARLGRVAAEGGEPTLGATYRAA